jgi:hypothetical protein
MPHTPMPLDALYLREKAHYCTILARNCRDLRTSQALEGLGVDLMLKAAELEKSRAIEPENTAKPSEQS